jgi:DNA recombination protein RmuC
MTGWIVAVVLLLLALPVAWWMGRRKQTVSATDGENYLGTVDNLLQNIQRVIGDQTKAIATLEERTKHIYTKAEAHSGELHKISSFSEQDIKAQEKVQKQVGETQTLIVKMKADYEARLQEEQRIAEAVGKLETKLLGSQSKGEAGENLVADILGALPTDMVRTNLTIKNKPVEFAIKLPNGKFVPLDSKMNENFDKAVRDVQQYIDTNVTESYAILALPDSRHTETRRAHYEASRQGVFVVSYSMLLPYLLTLMQMQRRFQTRLDLDRLHQSVERFAVLTEGLSERLEGHMARGLTMLQNAHQECQQSVGQLRALLLQMKAMDEMAVSDGESARETTPLPLPSSD